jgi:hypothetical protein
MVSGRAQRGEAGKWTTKAKKLRGGSVAVWVEPEGRKKK